MSNPISPFYATDEAEAGGFIHSSIAQHPSLLSPPPSSAASTTTTIQPHVLPQTRKKPLPSGSAKEIDLICYVDKTLTHISRKHALRLDEWAQQHEPDAGYTSFTEAAKDIQDVVDMIWISGTRKRTRR
jgi:Subunit 11 of the general transcription factor TFIIH